MLQIESQDQAQGVDADGSHTSLNIQAGPPSYGSPGSSQQQQQQQQCSDELGSSSLARKRVAAFDPGLADDVSQEQIDASDPHSSPQDSWRQESYNLQGSHREDRGQQHAGFGGRCGQGQGAVGAREAAEPELVGPALQELLVSLG